MNIKLAGFGLANTREFSDYFDLGFGNYSFASPKIRSFRTGISWAYNDIWSLGVVLHCLETRITPVWTEEKAIISGIQH